MNYKTYIDPPDDFNPTVEASGCYCKLGDKFLFLKRHPHKPEGNTWGIPGGKLEKGESPQEAMVRELSEEVGLSIKGEEVALIGKIFIRLPHIDYIFHMFLKQYAQMPEITLGLEEHQEAKWVTFSEAKGLPLITGGLEALTFCESFINGAG